MKKPEIFVHSIFYSLQGEGPRAGVPSVFLRLAGCNLRCSFCDTPQALEKGKGLPVEEVVKRVVDVAPGVKNLVITGGEPLLQIPALEFFLEKIFPFFYYVEIETNGTLSPLKIKSEIHYNVSPKLSNSGEKRERRLNLDVLREFSGLPSFFKFVVKDREDVEEVVSLASVLNIPKSRIYLMPMARNASDLSTRARGVALLAMEYGFRYSDRLHLRLSLP